MALPALPKDFPLTSFSDAVAISSTDEGPNVLRADLKRDWCIGEVPQGGYLLAVIASAAHHYFTTTRSSLNQPDLITNHVEYLSRTIVGAATLHITPLKLGRQFSTIRIQLQQLIPGSPTPTVCIEALVTQGNLAIEASNSGITLRTRPTVRKEEIPALATCVERRDPDWLWPLRTSYQKVVMLCAPDSDETGCRPSDGPSVRSQWVSWRASPQGTPSTSSFPLDAQSPGFDIRALCFLADTFRPLIEQYGMMGNWFPTMCCGVDVKRAPPPGGWKVLFMRIEYHVIAHGRDDINIVMLDEEGEVVALSRHTALIVPAARNVKVKNGAKM